MLARQPRDQLLERRAGGAVAGVPADAEGVAVEALEQAVDIGVERRRRRSTVPLPSSQSPVGGQRPSSWISSPKNERPFSTILKPL